MTLFYFIDSSYHVVCFKYCHSSTESDSGEPTWAANITTREISTRDAGVSADVGGIFGVFSRMQSYEKSDSPPPPYEAPPPYHIALVMEQCPACVVSEPVLV